MKQSEKVKADPHSLAQKMKLMAREGRNIPLTAAEMSAIPKQERLFIPKCEYAPKSPVTHRPNRSRMATFRKTQRRERFKRPGHVVQIVRWYDDDMKPQMKRIFHFKDYAGGN